MHAERDSGPSDEQSMTIRAQNINPAILAWARETAGLSIDQAAAKIGLSSSKKTSAAKKLADLEEGETRPTRSQLLKLAATYRRPLSVFYLNEPPRKGDRGVDFRTLPVPASDRDDALLDALLRNVRVRQELVRTVLEDDEDAERLEFVGSLQIGRDIKTVAEKIKAKLQIKRDDWTSEHKNSRDLFDDLRGRTESLGVFVLLMGNLGSRHSDIGEEVFRGFVIADDLAPFIVINEQDARVARSFTLAHELVHLFVGTTGVSALPTTKAPRTDNEHVERFCNDVASEMLLPTDLLKDTPGIINMEGAKEIISNIAKNRNLSESMIAYRLQRMGRIDRNIYSELCAFYEKRWHDHKQQNKERIRESDNGSPRFYYSKQRYCLGKPLLNLVGGTLRENQLTYTAAARMLGVKPSSVKPLLRKVKNVNGSYLPKA